MKQNTLMFTLILVLGMAFSHAESLAVSQEKLRLETIDAESGDPVAVRMELLDKKGKSLKVKQGLSLGRYALLEGESELSPGLGVHRFSLRRGPEFQDVEGNFTIERDANDHKQLAIRRKTDLRKEGWYSGDLLSTLPTATLNRWQAAEELDVAVTYPSKSKSSSDSKSSSKKGKAKVAWDAACLKTTLDGGYWDQRAGSGLLLHGYVPSVEDQELPSSQLIAQCKAANRESLVEIQDCCARDVPIWLATQNVDLIQVLTHTQRPYGSVDLGRVRNPDSIRFADKQGYGRLAEYIYWQMLESGHHLSPTAGSGFGNATWETHLGYNRVYVGMDGPPSIDAWWQALKDGQSFITNGPLLRARVNGNLPGHTFRFAEGERIGLHIELVLTVRDPVDYLDVIFNGKKIYEARLEDHAKRGEFPPLDITESGWLLIRVVTGHEASYRMASTAPFYFEAGGRARQSRAASKFFADWLEEVAQELSSKPAEWEKQKPFVEQARQYWSNLVSNANAE